MATQPFDPAVLADSLKNLGAASNITEKLKSDWADISKNLSDQEKNQRRLNVLSNLQSDISATISEQKKASVVYDEVSFNLEKRKLEVQQEIYKAQVNELELAIIGNNLNKTQAKMAKQMKDSLLLQNIALVGNLKVYEKQKNEGKKIEEQFKLVNGQLVQERKNILDVNDALVNTSKTKQLFALIAGPQFYKDLNVPKGAQESFERTYTLFKQIDKSATDLRMQFGLLKLNALISG